MTAELGINLNIRIGSELNAALKRAAEADGRTASNYLRAILSADLKTKGFLPGTKENKPRKR